MIGFLGITGLVVGAAGYLIMTPGGSPRRLEIYLALYVMHVAAAVSFWWLSLDEGYDAFFYYSDPLRWSGRSFEPGTVFLIQIIHSSRDLFGGSFLDYFLLFQAFGMLGVALYLRICGEIASALGGDIPRLAYLLAFLPGLHFWTVAIGKDAPLFMSVSLSVWAAMRVEKRFVWLIAAISIMLLFRPHVAAIACLSLSAAFVIDRRVPFAAKILLAPLTLAGLMYVVSALQREIGLNTLDANSITTYIEATQTLGSQYDGGANLTTLPFPLKVASFLFRPLFFDANGVLGIIASVENSVLIVIFGMLLIEIRRLLRLARTVFYLSYAAFFSSTLVLTLSLVNYNVGLGLRQKTMALPALLVIFATLRLHKRHMRMREASAHGRPVAAIAIL